MCVRRRLLPVIRAKIASTGSLMLCLWTQRCRTSTPTSSCTDSHIIAGIHRPHARRRDECSSSNATTRSPASCALPIPGKQPRRLDADWRLFLGELSSATSGSLTVALCAAAAELRGTGLLVRHEREQAPTASSGTAACPGVATLLLNARSRRVGCLLASTSGAPGGCSGVALAMRPMLVALCDTLHPVRAGSTYSSGIRQSPAP